jgi:hypothetical protein
VDAGASATTQERPPAAGPAGRAPVLGRYHLGERIGAGGFGTVHAGHDERLARPVAIKAIPAHGPAPERAQREARAVARLDHPAIVGLYDAGEEDGTRYLISELVHGRTLAQLERDDALTDRDVLRVGLALADGLAHAHERGVVHRDVKPQNIIVPEHPHSGRGAAKLTDFGVAHLVGEDPLTQTGDIVGTLAYMAPEQAAGRPVDGRADLYALALVLYEGLAGRNPVAAGSPSATARRIGTALPSLGRRRPDLPEDLVDAIDRAVAPDPAARGDLDDLFDALADALPEVDDAGGGALRPHPLERRLPALPPALGRVVAPAATGALVAAALMGLTPDPLVSPLLLGALAAVAVAVLPRAGWVLAAAATVALLVVSPAPRAGAAIIVAAGLLPVPFLLRPDGRAWSLPAAAPLLGLIGLAGAFPALAARAPTLRGRAALGALGAWWLLLAEPLLGRTLLLGPAADTPARPAFDGAWSTAIGTVLGHTVTSGALLVALLWGAGAAIAPWLVRGRAPVLDVVMAVAWAAGLVAATAAIGRALGGRVATDAPRGLLVSGLLAAAVLVVLARRPERRPVPDPDQDTG